MAGWRRADRIVLFGALAAGVLIRLWLLPLEGLRGDLDQFVGWVHHIATEGLGTLYGGTDAGPVTFGPVMAYIWALLALIQPAFATVTDASDPGDPGAHEAAGHARRLRAGGARRLRLRARPGWAAIGAAAVMLHPVVFDVSAWWGQYESIFVLSGLGATIAAINGRNGLAAALLAVSLMTKPQAIPFILPFAAWFWATGGIRLTRPCRGHRPRGDRRAVAAVHPVRRAGRLPRVRPDLLDGSVLDPLAPGVEPVVDLPGGRRRGDVRP